MSGEKERRRKEIEQHYKDKDTLKDGITVAEEVLKEVSDELGKHCEGKTIDTKKVKRCQLKLSMAIDRKKQLDQEVSQIEKKIQKLEEEEEVYKRRV